MSSKFSIRPAPRKRPWICKRSPPCLPVPPYPPSVLVSFQIQRRRPPPPQAAITGSFIALHVPPGAHYNGIWEAGFDYFDLWFHYDLATATGWSEAFWSAGPTSDHGNFPEKPIILPPNIRYTTAAVRADDWDWWVRLQITS